MRKIGYLVLSVLIGFCSCQHSTDRTAMHTVMVAHPENSGVKNGGKISLPGVIKEGQTVQVSYPFKCQRGGLCKKGATNRHP